MKSGLTLTLNEEGRGLQHGGTSGRGVWVDHRWRVGICRLLPESPSSASQGDKHTLLQALTEGNKDPEGRARL